MARRRLAMWIVGAVLVLSSASAASGLSTATVVASPSGPSTVQSARADQGAAVAVRPLGERTALDVRHDAPRPLLFASLAAVMAAALVGGLVTMARTGITAVAAVRWWPRRLSRGPPALAAV